MKSNLWLLLLLISCQKQIENKFEVITVYEDKIPRANNCAIKDSNFTTLAVAQIRIYSNGELKSYLSCKPDGFLEINFDSSDEYANEDKKVQYLDITRKNNQIIYFDKYYDIINEFGDSILASNRNNKEMYIFVGKIGN